MNGCQEVALILQRIYTPQQLELPADGAAPIAGVMPCGHHVGSQALAVLQQGPELDVPVACQVRIWCHACLTLQKVRTLRALSCIRVITQIMSLAAPCHSLSLVGNGSPQAASLSGREPCTCQED